MFGFSAYLFSPLLYSFRGNINIRFHSVIGRRIRAVFFEGGKKEARARIFSDEIIRFQRPAKKKKKKKRGGLPAPSRHLKYPKHPLICHKIPRLYATLSHRLTDKGCAAAEMLCNPRRGAELHNKCFQRLFAVKLRIPDVSVGFWIVHQRSHPHFLHSPLNIRKSFASTAVIVSRSFSVII